MLKSRLIVNARPFDELRRFQHFLTDYNGVVGDLMKETLQVVRPPLLDELQFYPPVPAGSRYRRTYRLRRGWDVRLVNSGEGYEIQVVNGVVYTKWVVGSFDQRRNYQTAVHQRNGWPLARNTVRFWFAAARDDFSARFNKYLSGFGVLTINRRNR